MSNVPDKTQHRASFAVVDVSDVSPVENQVKVQVALSPGRWGYTGSQITLVVPREQSEPEIRKWVCRKIKQETQLEYEPDELESLVLEAPSAPISPEEARLPGVLEGSDQKLADEIAADVVAVNERGKRGKRKGRKS